MQGSVSGKGNWLSVLIPAYNAAPHIEACIGSMLSQTQPGIEILVLDDASTDRTPEILGTLAASASAGAMTFWRNDSNCGVSATRNRLLDRCSGEYLWFVDADDLVSAGAVQALKRIVDAHAPDIVTCDFADYHRYGSRSGGAVHTSSFSGPARQLLSDRDTFLKGVLQSSHMYCWSRVTRRNLWSGGLRFPEGRFCEDLAVTPLLTARARTLYHEPAAWIEYREAEGSITANWTGKKLQDMVEGLSEITGALHAITPRLGADVLEALDVFCLRQALYCLKGMVRAPEAPDRRPVLRYCLENIEKNQWHRNWRQARNLTMADLMFGFKVRKWMFRARLAAM